MTCLLYVLLDRFTCNTENQPIHQNPLQCQLGQRKGNKGKGLEVHERPGHARQHILYGLKIWTRSGARRLVDGGQVSSW